MGDLFSQSHANSLHILIASAQTKGELCDLELVCDGQTIRVHKLVACLQSPVIKAACTGSFKEASGRYEMKDCEFANVKRMVNFFYNGDYKVNSSDQAQSTQELLVHVAMFTLADKYLVHWLRNLSQAKFELAVKRHTEPSMIPQYVKPVYGLEFESGKKLRDVVVQAVRRSVTGLPFDRHVREILEGLMDDFPEFAKDLAMSYIEKPQYALRGLFAGVGGKSNANPTKTDDETD